MRRSASMVTIVPPVTSRSTDCCFCCAFLRGNFRRSEANDRDKDNHESLFLFVDIALVHLSLDGYKFDESNGLGNSSRI